MGFNGYRIQFNSGVQRHTGKHYIFGTIIDINTTRLLQRKLLDGSLGFSSGVMMAASYWSLLAPAIELAGQDSTYGDNGEYAFFPALVGFIFGAFFVYLSDVFISLYEMDVLNILIPGKYI